ncbi:POK9 protein, partial [Orthonyx spaldingii]|nr:POK9 protein [Orthonyx spaldingii]
SGSLGLDLATTIDCTLMDCNPQRLPTGVKGPLEMDGQRVGALLLGHLSASMAGLIVIVGLIDADYEGKIQIMVQAWSPPLYIPAGSRIAQLVPLPDLVKEVGQSSSPRGEGGFGSTGPINLLTVNLRHR